MKRRLTTLVPCTLLLALISAQPASAIPYNFSGLIHFVNNSPPIFDLEFSINGTTHYLTWIGSGFTNATSVGNDDYSFNFTQDVTESLPGHFGVGLIQNVGIPPQNGQVYFDGPAQPPFEMTTGPTDTSGVAGRIPTLGSSFSYTGGTLGTGDNPIPLTFSFEGDAMVSTPEIDPKTRALPLALGVGVLLLLADRRSKV